MRSKDRLDVAVDATPLLGPRTGVGEFCLGILAGLSGRRELDVGAFAISWRRRHGIEEHLPPGISSIGRPMPARPLHWAWGRAPMPRLEWFTGRFDVVHGTNYVVPPSRAARVVTVHDLTTIRYPELCHPATLVFPNLVRKAVSEGAWVHVHSEFVANEVREALDVPPQRVRCVHAGIPTLMPGRVRPQGHAGGLGSGSGEGRRPGSHAATPGLVGLPEWVERYVLALGTVEPRKGLPTLVAAFDAIAHLLPGVALVLAGPDGWGTKELEDQLGRSHHRERVVRLGWVDQVTRDRLLENAAVFAYPSRYEGFGFPPLEAMVAGVPVVSTSAGSLEEVVGGGAEIVAVDDPDALAGGLLRILGDQGVAAELAERGRQWAARYTWDGCAEGLAGLYRDAFEDRLH